MPVTSTQQDSSTKDAAVPDVTENQEDTENDDGNENENTNDEEDGEDQLSNDQNMEENPVTGSEEDQHEEEDPTDISDENQDERSATELDADDQDPSVANEQGLTNFVRFIATWFKFATYILSFSIKYRVFVLTTGIPLVCQVVTECQMTTGNCLFYESLILQLQPRTVRPVSQIGFGCRARTLNATVVCFWQKNCLSP